MPLTSSEKIISHWQHMLENFQAMPSEFYASVDQAIKRRQVPEAKVSEIDWREGGLLSAKRVYLRVSRRKIVFDICCAPFGTGFFVSWWQLEVIPSPVIPIIGMIVLVIIAFPLSVEAYGILQGFFFTILIVIGTFLLSGALISQGDFEWLEGVLEIPVLGRFTKQIFIPQTYYRIDTMLMYQQAIHKAVLEVVDEMTTAKGMRALSEAERKPIMREFYGR